MASTSICSSTSMASTSSSMTCGSFSIDSICSSEEHVSLSKAWNYFFLDKAKACNSSYVAYTSPSMASTSSSMASSHPNQSRFDVFLSFRGEDTRHSFTDHLYAALKRAAIRTFRDDDEIGRGHDLLPEIVEAIKSSRASIVVLSENYAKSIWCLDELSLILEQRRKGNHFVLPVFYQVHPSDVRNQRQSFVIEAKDGTEGSKWTEIKVNRWKSALTEVANLAGVVASGSETKVIANIVDTVYYKLDLKLVSTPAHLTGMENRTEEINSWLKSEHSNTNVLAICGMGGSGKTTLAQHIYNLNKHNFESSCFLEDVGKRFKEPYGLIGLQKQLLTDTLDGRNINISCVSEGTTKIMEVLQRKQVLIVLDDIDDNDELSALLGTNAVHSESKIIITSRLLDIDSWFESISWRCYVYKLKLLNDDESLEVLSYHAFGSKLPLEGFGDLAIEFAQYCGGNPLALKVLGSSLFVSAKNPHEKNMIIEIWKSRLNSLSSLKGDLDCKIQGVLQKSYDSLPLASIKELFLHIVVFFVGEDEEYVVKILEHDCHARSGIMNLINRSLVSISPNKKLVVHQLLQDMGRNILRAEFKDPVKRTRVWCSDEAYRVLTKGYGSETTEGLTLDMRKLEKGTKAVSITTSSLAKMHQLKFLQLKYVKLSGYNKNFTELRWLCWHGCHLKAIPSGLLMSSFLVAIDMTKGMMEKFEPPMVLNSLKILSFTICLQLVSIHKLWRVPNLETLILQDCMNLTHVCKTIEGLKSLTRLNLAGCTKLMKLEIFSERLRSLCTGGGIPGQPLFSLPQSLKFLFLDYCDLEHPNGVRVVLNINSPLFGISLSYNEFEFIPNSIELKMLRVLNLHCCINLKSLPCLPSTLEELYIRGCRSLEIVTFESARFRLQKFGYKGCHKLSEVQGLFKLVAIKELDEANLGHMKWIKAYQDRKVKLVCNEIINGRIRHIQMLYEYGIMSTYLQDVKDLSMTTFEHKSADPFIYICVSLPPNKHKIQGLNLSCLYTSSRSNDENRALLLTLVSNITKGITWMYNPLVYCKPKAERFAMWLSYWPIGNMLDVGDEIHVFFVMMEGIRFHECGASLVYVDDGGEIDHEEKLMKNEEVIGGDLSEFQLNTGWYYLCRRDFFKSLTPDLIKRWFGDNIHYPDLQGWRKSYQLQDIDALGIQVNYDPELYRDTLYKRIWLGDFNKESDFRKIKKAVSRLEGVDCVKFISFTISDKKTLYVSGSVDSVAVETCAREFDKTVRIKDVYYKVKRSCNPYQNGIRGMINSCVRGLQFPFC